MLPGPFPFCTPGGGFGIQGSPSVGWRFFRPAGTASTERVASFGIGVTDLAFIRADGVMWARRTTDRSTLGDSRVLVLRDVSGLNNSRYEIGLGYHTPTDPDGNYQPVVIGHRITDGAGNTKGNFYIATRDVTTNTAPTERVEVAASGEMGIGKTPTAGVLLDLNGPLGFKPYTVATLPSAAIQAGQGVYVSDAAVAPCLAVSDGTNWKRSDNAATTVS